MCDIVFEKTKGSGGTVNRTSVYAEAPSKGFFEESVMRNFPSVPESFFFIKLNSADLQLH